MSHCLSKAERWGNERSDFAQRIRYRMACATTPDDSARGNAVFNVLLTGTVRSRFPTSGCQGGSAPFAFSRSGDMQGRGRARIQGMGDVSASEVGKLRTEVERLRRD